MTDEIKILEQKMQKLAITKGMLEKNLKELNITEDDLKSIENIDINILITEIQKLEEILKTEGISIQ